MLNFQIKTNRYEKCLSVLKYAAVKIQNTYPVAGFDVTRIALLSPTLATYKVLSNPSSDLFSNAATAVAPDATILFFRDCISVIKKIRGWIR